MVWTGVTLAALALAFATTSSFADYKSPDENTSEAYGPLKGDYSYSATLNQNGNNPDDQDWYYYYVPRAGDRLHWAVSNTNAASACPPYQCNVYATLEDSSGHQVGGSSSGAGTSGVGPGKTQTIDWTFKTTGKYYIAFIGDGPRISYRFSVTPASGVSSTAPRSGGRALTLHVRQAGRNLDFKLLTPVAGALNATAFVKTGGSASVAASLHRSHVRAGQSQYAIKLDEQVWKELAKSHRLTSTLRVTVRPSAGKPLHASKTLVLRR